MTPAASYFEDIEVGDEEYTPAMTLTEAHGALYRGLTGETPLDPETIPDLLPLCLTPGLGWRTSRPPMVVLAFMSVDWKIHRPTRIGDTIRVRARVALKRSMREGGVLIQDHEVVDQRGDAVQSGRFTFLLARRDGAPGRADGTG